ncbi:uncharacterized protein LOC111406837 [Olea europaea subsp. europaea]|uniref:Uncharacterized protein LOC111406837 n=1 Tax=Olea europaea subsp. europaea TaxID=158383 RepID=A0A8S0V120_OLEEU|nr:uncharacterized protein LOC111406837 [Olea europaea subsp. europaea]
MADNTEIINENSTTQHGLENSSLTMNENPLTLHSSDNLSLILVSKVLEPHNYGQWSRAMRIGLSAKNKIGLIDGSIEMPSPTNKTFHSWQRCNDMVLSWILNSVSPDIASNVIYMDSASTVWKDLYDRFSQGNESRIYQIQKLLNTDKIQIQSPSTSTKKKKKALWDELAFYQEPFTCTCGGRKKVNERMEKEILMQFLLGLNETYAAVRGIILMMSPLSDTRKAFSITLQHERQLDVASHHEGTNGNFQAMAVNQSGKPFKGSSSREITFRTGGASRKTSKCTYCDQEGHMVEYCYYLNGFPVGHKFDGKNIQPKNMRATTNNSSISQEDAQKVQPIKQEGPTFTTEEYNQIMAMLNKMNANATGKQNSPTTLYWIIDSGATYHTCHLQPINPIHQHDFVNLPDGRTAPINYVGSYQLSEELKLDGVLHVPKFRVNLLSISKLTKALNCTVTFFSDFCVIQDVDMKSMIGLGKQYNGLYYLSSHQNPHLAPHANNVSSLWYQRLGHPSTTPHQVLSKSILEISFDNKHVCEVCPLAKQTRLPFPSSSISSFAPFDLLHSDIWGPNKINSLSGAKYFLTIVDNFSHFTWVHLMTFKSEAQSLLRSFYAGLLGAKHAKFLIEQTLKLNPMDGDDLHDPM